MKFKKIELAGSIYSYKQSTDLGVTIIVIDGVEVFGGSLSITRDGKFFAARRDERDFWERMATEENYDWMRNEDGFWLVKDLDSPDVERYLLEHCLFLEYDCENGGSETSVNEQIAQILEKYFPAAFAQIQTELESVRNKKRLGWD